MKTALAVVANEADQILSPVVPYVETNPVSVLMDGDLRVRFFAEIEEEIAATPVDLDTKKGRDVIKSLAYKIARTKTAIDDAGKKLNEQRRKDINAVDAQRRECKEALEGLQESARKPLTEWEEAEKEREDKIKEVLSFLDSARVILAGDTSATLKVRVAEVEAIDDNADFMEAKAFALKTLNEGLERLLKEEADRAELARLRAEQAERERLDAEKRASEQREREEAERKNREEKAVQERAEVAAQRAADEAIAAERRKAEEAAAKAKAEHESEIARLAAEKRKLEEAETARVAEEKRLADEQERRENDRKHRSEIMKAAKNAFMERVGLEEQVAKEIVISITSGEIPNVSIRF